MIDGNDTRLKEALEVRLNAVLATVGTEDECYIIDEALGGLDETAIKDFKSAYGGRNPKREIKIYYAMPEQHEALEGFYVVAAGEFSETHNTLGNDLDEYHNWTGGHVSESLTVKLTEDGQPYMKTSQEVNVITSIDGMSGNYVIDNPDPRYIFLVPDGRQLVGRSFKVDYDSVRKGPHSNLGGQRKGFMADANTQLYIGGSNIDTVRCLRSLLIYLTIILREDPDEKRRFQGAKLHMEGISMTDANDGPLYMTEATYSYTTTYSVNYNQLKKYMETTVNSHVLMEGEI